MKKLEQKIIEKTYRLETRRTIGGLIFKTISIAVIFIGAFIVAQAIQTQYMAQQTLDLLQIFSEDIEVIKKYSGDAIYTIYQETPKDLLFLFICILFVGMFLILTTAKNFGKIKNKIRSIISHRAKHHGKNRSH